METLPVEVKKGGQAFLYTALLAFFSALVSIIATRKLNPNDFGDYQFLANYSSLLLVGLSPITWLLTRYTARGFDVRKEGLRLGGYVILLSAVIYSLPLFLIFSYQLHINFYEALSAITFFVSQSFFILVTSIVQGKDVSKSNEGNFVQTLLRFILFVIMIIFLAISPTVVLFLSVSASTNFFGFIYLLLWLRKIRGENPGKKMLESLTSLWHFPFFTTVASSLIIYDAVYFSLLVNSTLPLAYFRSAYIVAGVIAYVQAFSAAYYRSFLEKNNVEKITQAIKVISLSSFTLAFLFIATGDTLLAILRPNYVQAYPALIVLSLAFILGNLSTMFSSTISSMERLDIDTGIKKYKDSYFYTVLKIIIIQLLVQYSILTSIGLISKIYVIDAHLLAFYWALAWLLGNIIACSLFYLKLKSVYDFNFPYKAVAKYLFASLVPSLVAFIIKPKQVSLNFFLQLLNAIIPIAVYFIVFLASLMLLDKSMRSRIYLLIRTALNYFKSTL